MRFGQHFGLYILISWCFRALDLFQKTLYQVDEFKNTAWQLVDNPMFFFFHDLVANALILTSPFVTRPMPSFSSCDNTGTRDLKRYIVKHKPVTHPAIQTLTITRLICCQLSEEYNLPTFLLCAKGQYNDLMQTEWHVLTVLSAVHAHRRTETHVHTNTHAHAHSSGAWNQCSDAVATLAVVPFHCFYYCWVKRHCEPKKD